MRSSTSTFGHVGAVVALLCLDGLWILSHLHRRPGPWLVFGAFLLFAAGSTARDAVAWFRASPEEREAFRREAEAAGVTRKSLAAQNRARNMDPRLALFAATVMFGFMGWIFATSLPPLLVIPIGGWLYVAFRLRSEGRKARIKPGAPE